MYDISQRSYIRHATVGELIAMLGKFDSDATLTLCGSDDFYIHCTPTRSTVTLDWSELDDDSDE